MKYTLDTLPVLDAYRENSECPLCRLRIACEDQYVDSMLGAAYMEPDCRVKTNEVGFCPRHFQLMFERRNRLGLALMTHTHLQQVERDLKTILESGGGSKGLLASLRGGKSEDSRAAKIRERLSGCVICEQLDGALNRYAYTIAQLYGTNAEFKQMLDASKGFCLPHLALVLDMAQKTLPAAQADAFSKAVAAVELPNLKRLSDELERVLRTGRDEAAAGRTRGRYPALIKADGGEHEFLHGFASRLRDIFSQAAMNAASMREYSAPTQRLRATMTISHPVLS